MTLPEGIATLPCLFRRDCDVSSIIEITIHSIYDGIFMNGSFLEEEVCWNSGYVTLDRYTKVP